jgi:hypothetical protein
LVVLAAGLGSRFGGLKQLAPVGPNNEAIPDYNARDALTAGFDRAVVVVRREIEQQMAAHVAARWPRELPVTLVAQDGDAIALRHPRAKPLGTVHAVLAAAAAGIDGPFAVVNADDLYGADAFRLLADHLTSRADHCMVGYRVANTILSRSPVTRGICRVADNDQLVGVAEGTVTPADDGSLAWSDGGASRPLTGDELASMNCWGFEPAIVPDLQEAFADFIAGGGVEAGRESLLPTVVSQLLPMPGGQRVTVLPTTASCLGVTHSADLDTIRSRLAAKGS